MVRILFKYLVTWFVVVSVVCCTLVGVSMFSIMCSELLIMSDIS